MSDMAKLGIMVLDTIIDGFLMCIGGLLALQLTGVI